LHEFIEQPISADARLNASTSNDQVGEIYFKAFHAHQGNRPFFWCAIARAHSILAPACRGLMMSASVISSWDCVDRGLVFRSLNRLFRKTSM